MPVYYNIADIPAITNAVVTIGTFDGVHEGHMVILEQVVKHAAGVNGESVLITFEPHPRKLLFPEQPLKLLTPLAEKLQLIQNAGIQHVVVVPFTKEFAELSSEEYITNFLVKRFKPASIVIGYDHHFGADRKGDIDMLRKYAAANNYKVYEISAQLIEEAAVSSTKIRKAINEGQVAEATKMLGRNYCLKGKVAKGAQLGRTIGYPTANIVPYDADHIVPANGVYAVQVKHHGIVYNAMLNIGIRPTVSNDMQRHIEAHLFGFSGDLYDEELEVFFVVRLRDEQKFASLDALKEQLAKDKEAALKALD